ncbi:MAG: NAD(P)H-hydrate dehydratase [Acidimicrobiia bacterium]|nr:NAD(P)H-hydrate dehydratase [Acidimicrobiia bacterium]
MKILTAAEMREADRLTMEAGIPNLVLMENAGHRVLEVLERRFAPLASHRILVLCGKGNNGGDGLVIARQLYTRIQPRALWVVMAQEPPEHLHLLEACGCPYTGSIEPEMRSATIVVDALLGTGLSGPPRAPYLSLIREINTGFPHAAKVAVDLPSGLFTDGPATEWEHARADCTVTFTALKPAHVLEPNASACGHVEVGQIGTRPEFLASAMNLPRASEFSFLFAPREPISHKGSFGHVLVIGGVAGKTGAAEMTGIAALRAGAGLVTVMSDAAPHYVELMREPLGNFEHVRVAAAEKSVIALGPGLGTSPEMADMVRRAITGIDLPVVVDADALHALIRWEPPVRSGLILTPHPGEMSRLCGWTAAEIQANRIGIARDYARKHSLTLVLKGNDTVTAFPDGDIWVNPTGGPAMATAGSGDMLTGLIAGMLAQFPGEHRAAVVAAVWLHGRCGDLAAAELGEKCVIATDLLRFLPHAMEECAALRDRQ